MANLYCSSVAYTAVAQWSASTAVAAGAIRRQLATPTVGNERCFRCSTAGTTGGAEPTWVLTANATTTDGTAVWTECTGQALYNGGGGGSAWAAPFARTATAVTFSAAGDTVFVASNHAETQGSAISTSIPGTQAARTRVLSVDETQMPNSNTTTLKAGATVTVSSGNITLLGASATVGCGAFVGMTYAVSSTASPIILLGNNHSDLYFEQCKFQLNGNNSSPIIQIGAAGPASSNRIRLRNCSFKFANTGQYVTLRSAQTVVQNLAFEAGSLAPNSMFRLVANNTGAVYFLIMDSDLSLLGGNTLLDLSAVANTFVTCQMRNCKIASNLTLPGTVNRPGYRFRMDNCHSDTSYIRFYQVDFAGTVRQNTTTTVTGLSAEMTTLGNSAWEAPLEFELAPIKVSAGVPVTLSWNIACASQLTNSDLWIEVDYPATSGSTLGSIATTGMTTITGSPSNLAGLFVNWSINPGYIYTKTVTITPGSSGWALPVVKMAKKNTTVYVDLGGASLVPGDGFSAPSGGLLVHPGMRGGMRG